MFNEHSVDTQLAQIQLCSTPVGMLISQDEIGGLAAKGTSETGRIPESQGTDKTRDMEDVKTTTGTDGQGPVRGRCTLTGNTHTALQHKLSFSLLIID